MCKDVKSQIPDSVTADALSKFFSQKVESVRSATENAAQVSLRALSHAASILFSP